MARNKLDAYFTPPELTRTLLAHLDQHPMWKPRVQVGRRLRALEPCAGEGWISNDLKGFGYDVVTGDVDPQYGTDHVVDFLSNEAVELYKELDIDLIITNPPWSRSAECVRQALKIAPSVAMLLRMTFLEPCEGTRRSYRLDLLETVDAVLVLPRTQFIRGKKGTDTVPPAWFIWHNDEPSVAEIRSCPKSEVMMWDRWYSNYFKCMKCAT